MRLSKLLLPVDARLYNGRGEEIGLCRKGEECSAVSGVDIAGVTADSRRVEVGGLFFCIPGTVSDGHRYAGQAASAGAVCLVGEHLPDADQEIPEEAVIAVVENAREAMSLISAQWYDHPAARMKMIGVTGTKGKTTTTYLVRSILKGLGIHTGLIGTIESLWSDRDGNEVSFPNNNTTPESIVLQQTLFRMWQDGVEAVVMEVSSQALMMHRVAGIDYDIGVFTNLSPDHIGPGEHKDFEEYLSCKAKLFRQCRKGIANGDDPHVFQVMEGHTCELATYGMDDASDLYAGGMELIHTPGELGVAFDTHGRIEGRFEVPTPGAFSVYNALAAISVALEFGAGAGEIQEALKGIRVKGRIEMVPASDENGPKPYTLLIDYAHNAVALESLLSTLKEYRPNRLITLFGCGGNRSKLRRFEMGEVSGKLSDLTVITSDNPRFEKPEDIIADIETGIRKTDGAYITIPDRREAIRYCIENGQPGDIIVLAGKGHEDYQEIEGKKYPMDERVIIREILSQGTNA